MDSQMNHGKVGEPYDYPDSFMQTLGYMGIYCHLPYRQTQGVVTLCKYVPGDDYYNKKKLS